jgi:uncharacterized protein YdbL (DUF1318 family)
VFDGRIEVAGLRLDEPFGAHPTLYADILLRNLDLAAATGAFSFGSIEGRMSGELRNGICRTSGLEPHRSGGHYNVKGRLLPRVDVNVYFPAVAAERAADRIIDDVWGRQRDAQPAAPADETPGTPQTRSRFSPTALVAMTLNRLVPAAQAAEPDIDISSPAVQRIKAAMEQRHRLLAGHYESGAVGLTSDGLVALQDADAVPLAERNNVRKLVADESADRAALYREIALANGRPEWEADIRRTFAQRWIARAQAGWYYQDAGGSWVRK